jgi:hypothetical protein
MAEEEILIRLTPSGRRLVVAGRPKWGWRPGLPVLIVRKDGGSFAFIAAKPEWRPLRTFTSLGVRLAVFPKDADYFRGSVFSSNYDALFEEDIWWLENPNDPLRSGCSDPLGASCSLAKFRRLHPELFGLRGLVSGLLGKLSPADREQLVARTSAFLRWGDARAAVVLKAKPLLVASYCDEMDAVFLLRFPQFLVGQHAVEEGSRLVTTNLHRRGDAMAPDILPGPRYLKRYTNVRPLIADFLAAEEDLVEKRRRAIDRREYERCWELGQAALERGQPVRSGRPLEAAIPGTR